MTLKRPSRIATLGLSISLAVGLMAVPAATLAALPNWLAVSAEALPDTVTPGQAAGYAVTIHNTGPSNISQLYLFTKDGTESVVYSAPSQGGCPGVNGHLYCTLGSLRAGHDVTVVAAFATSATASGSATVTFQWNTTGLGSGGGDNSHGDTLNQTVTTLFSSDATNFAGRFVNSSADQTVQNNQTLGSGNHQATKVVVNNKYIPVTVKDGSTANPGLACSLPNTSTFSCADLFGEWSLVNVNNGAVFSSYFTITIKIDAGSVPSGTTKNNLVVYHQYGTSSQELISASCSGSTIPCRTVSKFSTYWLVEIHSFHNGNFRLG